jgi:NAD(P)H-hydrate epimerase
VSRDGLTELVVGVDLVPVARMERLLERHGRRFLDRYFTAGEQADCRDRPESVAGRWAAKEATVKALARRGLRATPRQVEVVSDGGPLRALVHGVQGVDALELSLSHDGGMAVAVATAALPATPPLSAPPPPGVHLPDRDPEGHKGTFGTTAVLAGSLGYTGAAYLSAMGAARSGSGMVRLLVAESIYTVLAAKCSEVMVTPLTEAAPGVIGHFSVEEVLRQMSEARAAVVGPGLGRDLSNRRLIVEVLRRARLPLVVDADGLNALAEDRRALNRLPEGNVFTPHPGEMARLSGLSTREVQSRREQVAVEHARRWGQVVVLKGAHTVIASPEGRVTVDPHRIPALASGGTGDVLAGIIGGLMAQGLQPESAAITGVYTHAEAAAAVSADLGDSGLLATDLLPEIPRVMHRLRAAARAAFG